MLKKILGVGVFLALSAGTAAAKDLNSIAVLLGSGGNPFFVQFVKGVEAQAKTINPNVRIMTASSDYDLNRQSTRIDNSIAVRADLILLDAADFIAIKPAVKRAQAAGIPVVAFDAGAPGADATITSDNVQAGAWACRYIVDKLKGQGDVVFLNGPPTSADIDRVGGCKNVLVQHPGIKILSDSLDGKASREGGMAAMMGLLTRFPKIDAVFAVNDPEGLGGDLAARQLKRTNLFITSVDGAPDIEAALKEDTLIEASAAQNPFAIAREAVSVGCDLMNGKKPAEDPILIPTSLVTRDTVADYKGWTTEQSG